MVDSSTEIALESLPIQSSVDKDMLGITINRPHEIHGWILATGGVTSREYHPSP